MRLFDLIATPVGGYTLAELEDMPDLDSCNGDDLKIDNGEYRIWIIGSPENWMDALPETAPLIFERLVRPGGWKLCDCKGNVYE